MKPFLSVTDACGKSPVTGFGFAEQSGELSDSGGSPFMVPVCGDHLAMIRAKGLATANVGDPNHERIRSLTCHYAVKRSVAAAPTPPPVQASAPPSGRPRGRRR